MFDHVIHGVATQGREFCDDCEQWVITYLMASYQYSSDSVTFYMADNGQPKVNINVVLVA